MIDQIKKCFFQIRKLSYSSSQETTEWKVSSLYFFLKIFSSHLFFSTMWSQADRSFAIPIVKISANKALYLKPPLKIKSASLKLLKKFCVVSILASRLFQWWPRKQANLTRPENLTWEQKWKTDVLRNRKSKRLSALIAPAYCFQIKFGPKMKILSKASQLLRIVEGKSFHLCWFEFSNKLVKVVRPWVIQNLRIELLTF